jgi:hypothetical protein
MDIIRTSLPQHVSPPPRPFSPNTTLSKKLRTILIKEV